MAFSDDLQRLQKTGKELRQIIENEFSRQVFELPKLKESTEFINSADPKKSTESSLINSHMAEQEIRLKEFNDSIEKLGEHQNQLFYLAFLGHFSAGKSSTINSLLPKAQRSQGANPTDREITLIASTRDKDKLIQLKRAGKTNITAQFLNVAFLDNLVIIDTPGKGDPEQLGVIVSDFLPVCDAIFYIMSAASPFSDVDATFLKKLVRELDFLRIQFVITRGDEFVKPNMSLSDPSNFDKHGFNEEMIQLEERINSVLPELKFQASKVVVIDNKAEYGIEDLRDEIDRIRISIDFDELRTKKIEFFRNGFETIKQRFGNHLQPRVKRAYEFNKDFAEFLLKLSQIKKQEKQRIEEDWKKYVNKIRELQPERVFHQTEEFEFLEDSKSTSRDIEEIAEKTQESINKTIREFLDDRISEIYRQVENEYTEKIKEVRKRLLIENDDNSKVEIVLKSTFPVRESVLNSFDVDVVKMYTLANEKQVTIGSKLCNEIESLINKNETFRSSFEGKSIPESVLKYLNKIVKSFVDALLNYASAIDSHKSNTLLIGGVRELGLFRYIEIIEEFAKPIVTEEAEAELQAEIIKQAFEVKEQATPELNENLETIKKRLDNCNSNHETFIANINTEINHWDQLPEKDKDTLLTPIKNAAENSAQLIEKHYQDITDDLNEELRFIRERFHQILRRSTIVRKGLFGLLWLLSNSIILILGFFLVEHLLNNSLNYPVNSINKFVFNIWVAKNFLWLHLSGTAVWTLLSIIIGWPIFVLLRKHLLVRNPHKTAKILDKLGKKAFEKISLMPKEYQHEPLIFVKRKLLIDPQVSPTKSSNLGKSQPNMPFKPSKDTGSFSECEKMFASAFNQAVAGLVDVSKLSETKLMYKKLQTLYDDSERLEGELAYQVFSYLDTILELLTDEKLDEMLFKFVEVSLQLDETKIKPAQELMKGLMYKLKELEGHLKNIQI